MAFDTFTHEDILKGNTWKGRELTAEEMGSLKAEAAAFKETFLWKVLSSDLQWFALKSLIERGETAEDIRAARAIGNVVQQIGRKLDELTE